MLLDLKKSFALITNRTKNHKGVEMPDYSDFQNRPKDLLGLSFQEFSQDNIEPETNTESSSSALNFEDFWSQSKEAGSLPSQETVQSSASSRFSVKSVEALQAATAVSVTGFISTNIVGTALGAAMGFNNNPKKAEQFSQQVTEYATNDEVITVLSQEIGEPKANETEDQFVERASESLRSILRKKFGV